MPSWLPPSPEYSLPDPPCLKHPLFQQGKFLPKVRGTNS